MKKNFKENDYSIEYMSSGKCVVSGNCMFDPLFGCDGGVCQEYTFLEGCKSYYYSVEIKDETYTITVFYKDKVYSVIEGENIYGLDN